jgi:hypothetical protein
LRASSRGATSWLALVVETCHVSPHQRTQPLIGADWRPSRPRDRCALGGDHGGSPRAARGRLVGRPAGAEPTRGDPGRVQMRTRAAPTAVEPPAAVASAEPAAPAQPQPKFRADDCVRGVRWAEVCSGAAIMIDGAAPHISGGIGDAVPATVLDGSDKKRYQVTDRGQFSVAGQTAARACEYGVQ